MDLKNVLSNSLNYNSDFTRIIFENRPVYIYAGNERKETQDSGDSNSILYFTISESLIVSGNIYDYINGSDIISSQINNNLIYLYNYIFDDWIGFGYHGDKKKKKLNERRFCMNLVYLYLNLVIYILSFILSIFIIYRKYKNEIYYLGLMIDFQSEDFNLYLKYLDDLKKKLKNETSQNENDKEKKEDNEENDKESINDNKNIKNREKKSSKRLLTVDQKSDGKKINKKSRKSKTNNKYYQQREEKKKIMNQYFLNQSIFSGYKIGFVFILAMSYYILIYFLYKNKKNKYIFYDDIETDLVSTALNTFLDYAKIKHEICDYINYLNEYNNCLNELNNDNETTCII